MAHAASGDRAVAPVAAMALLELARLALRVPGALPLVGGWYRRALRATLAMAADH